LLSAYSYLIYPLLLLGLRQCFKREVRRAPIEPSVSVIIAVHNEERSIREKIRNTLAVNYPHHKLQILVASDASTDGTDAAVREFPEVLLCRSNVRKGKEFAQRSALTSAQGEILVFTDAGTLPPQDFLGHLTGEQQDAPDGGDHGEAEGKSESSWARPGGLGER
jgi:cellulose synthase/poly-beta-1,6-N-acetylglucosamine synthase-like glycosyltransferase